MNIKTTGLATWSDDEIRKEITRTIQWIDAIEDEAVLYGGLTEYQQEAKMRKMRYLHALEAERVTRQGKR